MNVMQITLGKAVGSSSCEMDPLLHDAGTVLTISSNEFQAVIRKSPELSLSHVAQDGNHQPLSILLVFGHVEFMGDVCSSGQDADRLLKALERPGFRVLNQLDGSFLIVIHEIRPGKTTLISDPFGSRPLWMAKREDTICLGNIPQQVAEQAGRPLEPDPAWLWSMVKFRRTVGERSSIRGVHGLPAGSVMTYEQGTCKTETWFDFSFQPKSGQKASDFGRDFLELTASTVSRTCAYSERPSLLLSGGLDSRLLAAVSPSQMQCLTLCDSVNREVTLARRIARVQNLSHEVIVRPENWYPDLVEPSCQLGGGVWMWDQAHFLPLGEQNSVGDSVLLGYGSDTLFKGKDIDATELWNPRFSRCSAEELVSEALDILDRRPLKISGADHVLNPEYAAVCRAEFLEESRRQLQISVADCSELPDLWQSFWNRNMVRAGAFMNLVSLRGFTRERNVFTTVAMRRFYLSLPSDLRRSGRLPLLALQASGYRQLLSIPDANTWLPYTMPRSWHHASAAARRTIAGIRKNIRSKSRNTDYRSNCSWPHNGRLWLHSDKMTALMDHLVRDQVFDASRFAQTAVEQVWTAHRSGRADYSSLLDFLGTYGAVFGKNTAQNLNRDDQTV